MDKYTVEYKVVYYMTQEVKADSEEEALRLVEDDPGGGIENDVRCCDYKVVDVEEHELTDEEIADLRADEAYDRWKDDQFTERMEERGDV